VAHEALIRHWPRLVGWINRDRAFQSWLHVELMKPPAADGDLLGPGFECIGEQWPGRRNAPSEGTDHVSRAAISGHLLIIIATDADGDAIGEVLIERPCAGIDTLTGGPQKLDCCGLNLCGRDGRIAPRVMRCGPELSKRRTPD
jgi:hypothetical protein